MVYYSNGQCTQYRLHEDGSDQCCELNNCVVLDYSKYRPVKAHMQGCASDDDEGCYVNFSKGGWNLFLVSGLSRLYDTP